ncbi:MAG TPA: YbhB/YbcL family Raf kinase inhibitor-like protein [Nitrospiria bacterium]|nr:YbhB/YbcL family Raf kinase inhibitor-like protein [Nitrospiria bacterium]
MAFTLTSPVIGPGQVIPKKYTCDGPDVSLPLAWSDPPAGTRSLALIADDPDAPVGDWVHWVLYDLPAHVRELPEGVPRDNTLPDGSKQGKNDFGRLGYGGPCPPPGRPHRYVFTLYAVDRQLGLAPGATKAQLLNALKGHILGEAQWVARYGR